MPRPTTNVCWSQKKNTRGSLAEICSTYGSLRKPQTACYPLNFISQDGESCPGCADYLSESRFKIYKHHRSLVTSYVFESNHIWALVQSGVPELLRSMLENTVLGPLDSREPSLSSMHFILLFAHSRSGAVMVAVFWARTRISICLLCRYLSMELGKTIVGKDHKFLRCQIFLLRLQSTPTMCAVLSLVPSYRRLTGGNETGSG